MLNDFAETISHCLKCGACKTAFGPFLTICPSGFKYGFESHFAIGRVEIAKAVLDGRLELNASLMNRIYSCTSCGGCDQQCGHTVGVFPLQIIEELKREAITKGFIPPSVRDFLKNMSRHGNPFLEDQGKRGEWARGLKVNKYDGQEFLFYVGCVGSFDERGKKISRALSSLLFKADIDFGILGAEETCDGNEVSRVGERGLFEYLAEQNIEIFKNKGVRKIITLSPHAYNAFKKDYTTLGAQFDVTHHAQLLNTLVKSGKIKVKRGLKKLVTFHDPCFLGRHNADFDSAREILTAIPHLILTEMEMNRENSFCCGGGGGNFFTDILGSSGERSPARVRIRQALETKAEIIAVACPNCAKMLEDAVKAEGVEERIAVKDISEILQEVV